MGKVRVVHPCFEGVTVLGCVCPCVDRSFHLQKCIERIGGKVRVVHVPPLPLRFLVASVGGKGESTPALALKGLRFGAACVGGKGESSPPLLEGVAYGLGLRLSVCDLFHLQKER